MDKVNKDYLKLLAGFIKNGEFCTNFPEKINSHDYRWCCYIHDAHYTKLNYNKFNRTTRFNADLQLFKCVKNKSNLFIASIMFIGVRTVGWYYFRK